MATNLPTGSHVGPNGRISPFMGRRCRAHWYVENPVKVEGAHAV
jgi:hypothetical protein